MVVGVVSICYAFSLEMEPHNMCTLQFMGGDTKLMESSEKACIGLNWLLQTWFFHALALKLSPPLKCHIICTNDIEPNKVNYNHPPHNLVL